MSVVESLYDVLTADLVSELKSRGYILWEKSDPSALIAELKSQNYPVTILDELCEWIKTPVKTERDLSAWKEFCRK